MASISRKIYKQWDQTDHVPYDGKDTTSGEAAARGGGVNPIWSQSTNAYNYITEKTSVDAARRKNYEVYEAMDDEYAPASAVLDAYADNCTQLDMNSEATSADESNVINFISDDEKLKDDLAALREKLKLNERAWSMARDLTKMGEVFEEIVVTSDLEIDRLKQLPAHLMVRNQDDFGLLKKDAFYQLDKSRDKVAASFHSWEVIHYRLLRRNEDAYGTSILKSVRKVYKQLRMIEDAMVIARLTRANSRLVYMVDTGGLTPDQAYEHLEKMKKQLKRKRLTDAQGLMRMNVNPMTVEEDIFMATSDKSDARVEQLYGDLNIGNLTDVEYFQNQFFGGVKVPKSYVGLERDLNSKQTLSMQDIQFARSIRRVQLAMRVGYQQLINLHLLLGGATPEQLRKPQYKIALPSLQTVDELRQWEIKRIQREVARYDVQELFQDPVSVYTRVLGFSKQEAEALYKGKPDEYVTQKRDMNQPKALKAQGDKKVSQVVGEAIGWGALQDLRDLCEMALEQYEIEAAKEKGTLV